VVMHPSHTGDGTLDGTSGWWREAAAA